MKKLLFNLLTLIISSFVSCVALFLIGETYFKFRYDFLQTEIPAEKLYQYDRERGWALRPGEYSYFSLKAFQAVNFSINSLGLRNGPVSLRVPKGKRRISISGDSFVFSPALSDGYKFTDRLQELAGKAYEIVNISVPGYGTGQEYRLLQDLSSIGFDIGNTLVLAFFTNDIQDNLGLKYGSLENDPHKPVFKVNTNGNLQQTYPKPTNKKEQNDSFLGKSLFYHFIRSRSELVIAAFPTLLRLLKVIGVNPALPRTPGVISGWYGPNWETRWRNTERVLEYVVNQLRSDFPDLKLYILFIPSPFQVESVFRDIVLKEADRDSRYKEFLDDMDRPQRLLRSFCQANNVPFIDPTHVFRKIPLSYFLREGHLNEHGSGVLAKIIFDSVIVEK